MRIVYAVVTARIIVQLEQGAAPRAKPWKGSATKKDETGEEAKHRFLRFHSIFNVEQVEGLPERFTSIPPPRSL